jgi:AraC-like DNA-binding protein
MSPSLIDSLCAATSAMMTLQSLFLGLVLIAQPARRSHANLALAIASLAFACAQWEPIFRYWVDDPLRTEYFWAASHLPLLFIPPFAYLHVVGLTSGPSWRFSLGDIRHGVFCIAGCLLFAIAVALDSQALATRLIYGIFLIMPLQGTYYLVTAIRLTRRGSRPQIAWLRLLLVGLAAFLLLHVAIHILYFLLGDQPWARLTTHILATLALYAIAFGSLTHGKVFSRSPEEVLHALTAPIDKYRKSRQSAQEANRILIKLDHAVLADSLYREAGLTLPMLAAKVGTKPNVISQALNQTLGLNFFDYINGHRIDEAKRLLETGEDGTILDIAYEVGFNSKSTFNAAFKKHTGQTPSLFRKQGGIGTSL